MTQTPTAFVRAREEFLALVQDVRPELHRYCARLTGSVIEGEDIVQDALARAFYALSLQPDVPQLRPWLFRIAHNAALDLLKSHGRKYVDSHAQLDDLASFDERADPSVVRTALAHFLTLPLAQRSAVILKDVLGHSLDETAETMGISVMAVKAALVRGREKLRVVGDGDSAVQATTRADLERYASRFNARDWDGVRALIGDDCKLDVVSKSQRRGKQVRMYFDRYEKEVVTLRVARLEGRLALAAYLASSETPAYFILLEIEHGLVTSIRDFRYVPYITADADLELI